MQNGRANTAFEYDPSEYSSDPEYRSNTDSESLDSLVNPTSISVLIEGFEKDSSAPANSKSDVTILPKVENYDDLRRKKFIRPGPCETNLSGQFTSQTNGLPGSENQDSPNNNNDILITDLKEDLEDEEFLNSELVKKNNFLEDDIERLKDQLEEMEKVKDAIEIRLKDEQETLSEIIKQLQEEKSSQ